MTSLRLLGAALIAASALASSAHAQGLQAPFPTRCAFTDPNCQAYGPGDPFTRTSYQNRRMTRRELARREMARREAYRENPGFGPLNAMGALAGAAVGTAGAALGTAATIATAPLAPFGAWDNSYAAYGYDTGFDSGTAWNGDWDSYAAHNGIICRPGTFFKGADGRRHLCQ